VRRGAAGPAAATISGLADVHEGVRFEPEDERAMGVVLKVVEGPRAGLEYRAGERTAITIGRSKTTDFHVLDTSMSRVHAVVARDDEGWYVEDCKSSNGLWMGDERVQRERLTDGATFRTGHDTVIRFTETDAEHVARDGEVIVTLRCRGCGESIAEADLVRGAGGLPFHLACRNLDHLVGTTLGEFKLVEKQLARGDGFYFRAHQPSLSRSVTLAVFDAPLVARPGYRDALLAEVRRASRFLHPSVLQILDFGEARGNCYVVMEHFDGIPLSAMLEERRFVVIRGAVEVARKLLAALQYVRDQDAFDAAWVSSTRVLVSPKHDSKLWLFRDPGQLRRDPVRVEAPYIAPEVSTEDAEVAQEPALVYSVAALLYHMLAGIPPFEGTTTSEVTKRSLQGRPPALRRINLKVSPALAGAVETALSRDPASRPESLRAFAEQLGRAAGGR
jgi:pSer/pThr/pTyr-binding forkhead associated (FHA) protein